MNFLTESQLVTVSKAKYCRAISYGSHYATRVAGQFSMQNLYKELKKGEIKPLSEVLPFRKLAANVSKSVHIPLSAKMIIHKVHKIASSSLKNGHRKKEISSGCLAIA